MADDLERSQTTNTQKSSASGEQREFGAEHWGVTTDTFRALIDDCRKDPRWTRRSSVRDLVNDYVKPLTAGTGMGYALLKSGNQVREVSIMVSHSWSESAEEFLEALERTVSSDDVLFICALSIFQNEDGSGPSIADQLGASAQESPFFVVLENIARRGGEAGRRWRPKLSQRMLPWWCVAITVVLLWLPLVLTKQVCTWQGLARWDGARWQYEGQVLLCRCFLGAASLAACCALACWVMERLAPPFVGRMVATPNCEDDLYSRLWCVYEMFVAIQRGVHVQLAPTMASAGHGSCRDAACSNAGDERRIRNQIELSCGGYEHVDAAIHTTMLPQWWNWLLLKSLLMLTFLFHYVPIDPIRLLLLKGILLSGWAYSCWSMAIKFQGQYTTEQIGARVVGLAAVAGIAKAAEAMAQGSGADMASEVAKFMGGCVFMQMVWFMADRATYRVPVHSPKRIAIAACVVLAGCGAVDRRELERVFAGKDEESGIYLSAVSLLGVLMWPFIALAIWWLDNHWGIHWQPSGFAMNQSKKAIWCRDNYWGFAMKQFKKAWDLRAGSV